MGKLCENQQEIYAAYRVANLLGVYEDCSPNGFYQRWKQKNAFMKAQAEEFGIGSTDHFIDAVERTVDQRRAETEWKHADAWKNGTAAFGARYLTPEMYLDYELKSIQLAFATYKGEMVGNHKCHVYTEDEKRAFYDANQDLFTRYHGDLFSYEEVDLIIEKWLKVQEYQDIIESVVANTHLNETTVNEISAQDVSDEKSDNAVQWITEFEKIWNQMQVEQCQREDQNRSEETESGAENCGRCYYVSSLHGDDANDGAEDQPLKSLYAVNRLKLQPGDQVLLERGSVFENQFLHLNVQGTKEQPIYIGAYGNGAKPLIQTNGQGIWYQDYGNELDAPTHVYRGYVSSAVLLYDCEYLTVENLEISNKGGVFGETYSAPHKMNRTGVAGIAKNRGTLHEIHLSNLYIHDVEGNVYDKHMNNGGIYFTCLKPEAEDKKVLNVSRITVLVIAVVACIIAWNPDSSIMGLVSDAWAGLGSAFGPLVVCSLFWKRTNLPGAVAGIVSGGLFVIIWDYLPILGGQTPYAVTGIYSLLLGFFVSLLCIVIVSLLTKAPSKEIVEEFESVKTYQE